METQGSQLMKKNKCLQISQDIFKHGKRYVQDRIPLLQPCFVHKLIFL